MNPIKPITILLVEDDLGHASLVEKNLRRANIMNQILWFGNGQEVLEFLFGEEHKSATTLSDAFLILLDLNMPVMDGYEVLGRLKTDEHTKSIPIIVLTTTYEISEITRCYDLGCNLYITKPVDYAQFSEVINKLGLFLTIVRIPEGV